MFYSLHVQFINPKLAIYVLQSACTIYIFNSLIRFLNSARDFTYFRGMDNDSQICGPL